MNNTRSEYTARLTYPTVGWANEDEAQAVSGPISAVRLAVRTFVLGTVDFIMLSPTNR